MNSVLVCIGYTDFKYYVRPLFPRIFLDLSYENKTPLFVTDKNYPGLSNFESGDIVTARLREFGVNYAVKHNFDYIFFLDVDAIPDEDIIEELMTVKSPIAGAVVAWRGDSTKIIGHNYRDRATLEREPLRFNRMYGTYEVDGTSGAALLVHKSVFTKVDYSGYKGVGTIPGRTTCDDEFYQIKVFNKLKIRPALNLGVRVWHLHSDGFAYQWYGQKKPFITKQDKIYFERRIYEPDEI
jgi:hypothetical protein